MLPLILEPRDLEPLLGNDKLLIIDLCSNDSYQRIHVPGAIHVEPRELISGVKPAVGKLPSLSQLNALVSRIGLSEDKHVIAYDDEGGGWAGRFLWTLEVVGHKSWSYLNGGLVSWVKEKRPIQSKPIQPQATILQVQISRDAVAEKTTVLDAIDSDQTVIWDARSPGEYLGHKVFAARSGHIPGAINLDWQDTMDPNNGLRIRSDIAEILQSLGITRDKRVITHCQTHHRSGLTWLIGKALDYNIQAYHGSWSEWGNDPDTPIEQGE